MTTKTTTPDLRIRNSGLRRVRVADLADAPWNHRKHPQAQAAALDGAIDELGFYGFPDVYEAAGGVLMLIDGHLRKERLLARYGADAEIEVNVTDFDEGEAKKANLTKDPLAAMAEESAEKLDALLRECPTGSEALQEMLAEMAKDAGLYQAPPVTEDEVPKPPTDPVTKPGDLWLLGEHRLLCGDSTKAEDVARVLGGRKPFIMVTDPPYGVEYDPAWRQEAVIAGHLAKARRAVGKVTSDDEAEWTDAYKLFTGDVSYVWHAGKFAAEVILNLREASFECRSQIIWIKPAFAISRGDYHWQHEPCWYAVRKGKPAKWCGDRSQSTRWDISNRQKEHSDHGTQKPVECMARPIRNHGGPEDDVYDPFLGSGTTIVAAEQLKRRCYGLELEPKYCDVIVQRWETLTGKKAEVQHG
jgi:DNA modification methylase